MDNRTYNIVGTSFFMKAIKFRVANGESTEVRQKVLERGGHTDVHLILLPEALPKAEAIAAYKAQFPDTANVRMPNEKLEVAKTPKTKTVTIKKGKKSTADAATELLAATEETAPAETVEETVAEIVTETIEAPAAVVEQTEAA